MVGPDLTIGAFVGFDQWFTNDWEFFGAEAVYAMGNWTAEAFAGKYGEINTSNDANIFGLGVNYGFGNNISVFGEYNVVSNSGFDSTHARLGGMYYFTPAAYVSLNVDSLSFGGGPAINSVGISVGHNIGDGTTFGPRHYVNFAPGG